MAIGRASVTSPDFPSGPPTAAARSSRAGREWGFQHVNVGNPQCVIEVGDEVEELDLARSARRSRPTRAVSEPHQRLVHRASTARRCGRGSSSAGWGRRSPREPAPAAPRSPPSSAAPRARSPSASTAASSRSRSPTSSTLTLIGTASRVYAGELDRALSSSDRPSRLSRFATQLPAGATPRARRPRGPLGGIETTGSARPIHRGRSTRNHVRPRRVRRCPNPTR